MRAAVSAAEPFVLFYSAVAGIVFCANCGVHSPWLDRSQLLASIVAPAALAHLILVFRGERGVLRQAPGLRGVPYLGAAPEEVENDISRPIEELRIGAEVFSAGNLEHKLTIPDTEELASLAEAMNKMADRLDRRIAISRLTTLEEAKAKLLEIRCKGELTIKQ